MKAIQILGSVAVLTSAAGLAFPCAAAAAGSITGVITLEGTPPQRQSVKMSADPQCVAANPDGRLGEVFLVKDGKLQNVFVYVKEGLGDRKFEVPTTPAVLDQVDCMYTPRVLGVMAGQTIEIKNSDGTLHNVHALPAASKPFNNAMPMKGMTIKRKFTAPEVMVRLKCDVHPWMAAYIGVVDHPFFAVSGESGTFTIANVPAGTYTVEAWHEKLGTQSASITVADGTAANADFSFKMASE